MDLPDIARVFGCRGHRAGRPYFVMELVKPIAITSNWDQEKLSTKDRLDLFIQVCQAIQQAHRKGIIHINPSNIMVTLHDGVPVPKVIDFGITRCGGEAKNRDQAATSARREEPLRALA